MNDLDYIKKFSKIKIARICRDMGISSSNLWAGRLSDDKVHIIRKIIESEIGEIYVKECKQYDINSKSRNL